jgi:hypothetical protein
MHLAPVPPKRRNETRDVLRPIMSRLNRMPGVRVVRSANYGPVYAKRFYDHLRATGQPHPDARPMVAGLGAGSADLVGIVLCAAREWQHGRFASDVSERAFGRVFCLEVKLPPTPYEHKPGCACIRDFGPCDCGSVKRRPGGKTRPDQDRWLASVRKLGGFACVVRSVDEAVAAVARCRQGWSQ